MANEKPVPSSNAETVAIATTNGQTAFSFDWRADAANQVHAVYRPVGLPERDLALGADFSVQGLQNPAGGSILLVGFSANKDDVIYIYRETPIEREKSWQNEGDYKADLVNKEQDEIYMILQENRRDLRSNSNSIAIEAAARIAGDQALSDRIDGMVGDVNDAAQRAEIAAAASEGSASSSSEAADRAEAAAAGLNLPEIMPDDKGKILVVNDQEDGYNLVENSVPDGAITDSKIPDYDPSISPSASKLIYQASTSSGSIAASVVRPVQLKLSDFLNAVDFGVQADGISNDTASMVAAFSAMEQTGRPLFLPAGTIMVDAGVLKLGNGTASTYSTKNCQALFGAGENAYMNPLGGVIAGTSIKARPGISGVLLDVVGGVGGLSFSGFSLDCNGHADTGLNLLGVSHSDFDRITVKEFKAYGIKLVGRSTTNPNSPTWCANNTFKNVSISSTVNQQYAAGLYMDGDIATNRDPHRNTFINVVIQVNKTSPNPAYGAYFAMVDSNTFIECDFNVVGSGLGYPLVLSNTETPGHPFPQNNFFYGCSLGGGTILVIGDIGDHFFVNHTTMDGEPLPTHPNIKGFTDRGEFFSDLVVNKNTPALELKSRDGLKKYRLINNSNDSVDGGVILQKWSTASNTWVAYFAIDSSGTPAFRFPSIGLKQVQVGAPDTGGNGFRRLVVDN